MGSVKLGQVKIGPSENELSGNGPSENILRETGPIHDGLCKNVLNREKSENKVQSALCPTQKLAGYD